MSFAVAAVGAFALGVSLYGGAAAPVLRALAFRQQLRTTNLLLEIEARHATFRREPLREYLATNY